MAHFLEGLPCHNQDNFTKFHPDATCKTTVRRPTVYISTTDHPSDQVITTEKTNILLRFLHQQWDKKKSSKKRDSCIANLPSENTSPQKMPRLNLPDDSNS